MGEHDDATAAGSPVGRLGWVDDIERLTLDNTTFRTVVHTGSHLQLTLMRLGPGEEVGWEMHDHLDQFLRIERGTGRLDLGPSRHEVTEQHEVRDDWALIVPAGIWHNVTNTGADDLHLYSLYAPPEHPHGTVHRTPADAARDEHH